MHEPGDVPLDFYATPAEAVRRLFAKRPELLKVAVWDPYAGENGAAEAVRAVGGDCIGDKSLKFYEPDEVPAQVCVVHPPHGTADSCCRLLTVLDCAVWSLLPLSWLGVRWRDDIFHRIREVVVLGKLELTPVAGGEPVVVDCCWVLFKPGNNSGHNVILERAEGEAQ
jgi:hypothetical protein